MNIKHIISLDQSGQFNCISFIFNSQEMSNVNMLKKAVSNQHNLKPLLEFFMIKKFITI